MATLPAPRTSTVKWQIVERQTTSKFSDQKYFSGLTVFKKQKTFKKIGWNMAVLIFLWFTDGSSKKKLCAHFLEKKI